MWRRMRQGRGQGGMVGVRSEAILHRMVRDGHSQKVTFQQRPEGREGGSHAEIQRKSIQAERTASEKALRQKRGCHG